MKYKDLVLFYGNKLIDAVATFVPGPERDCVLEIIKQVLKHTASKEDGKPYLGSPAILFKNKRFHNKPKNRTLFLPAIANRDLLNTEIDWNCGATNALVMNNWQGAFYSQGLALLHYSEANRRNLFFTGKDSKEITRVIWFLEYLKLRVLSGTE